MKKKIKIVIVLGIILIISTTAFSLAYFNSKDKIKNEFTVGKLEGKIVEENFKDGTDINLGEEIDKKVEIQNTCKNPELIRVIITPQWEDNEEIISASNEIKLIFSDKLKSNVGSDEEENYWVRGTDGYYYYIGILNPKKEDAPKTDSKTPPLLEKVFLKNNIEDEIKDKIKGKKLHVNVSLEGIQVNKESLNSKWNIKDDSIKSALERLIQNKQEEMNKSEKN